MRRGQFLLVLGIMIKAVWASAKDLFAYFFSVSFHMFLCCIPLSNLLLKTVITSLDIDCTFILMTGKREMEKESCYYYLTFIYLNWPIHYVLPYHILLSVRRKKTGGLLEWRFAHLFQSSELFHRMFEDKQTVATLPYFHFQIN